MGARPQEGGYRSMAWIQAPQENRYRFMAWIQASSIRNRREAKHDMALYQGGIIGIDEITIEII